MKSRITAIIFALAFSAVIQAATYHVAPTGNNTNPGTDKAPFRSIQCAADHAQPGDVIVVHAGVYRERVSPPRGGTSDERRIVYEAAAGERVVITGSEVIGGWVKLDKEVWKATLPNSFFGAFNPYSDLIHGDWFNPMGREHHTGAVYLNGDWLAEAAKLNDVMKPAAGEALWFAQVDKEKTTIWAQFKGVNPNEQHVEINVRQTVFYPQETGIDYITVRGFTLENAATPWAPPTAEQIGLIGAHWSKGWVIENNVIRHSICSGISLGKYGDQWDNTSADTAEGYVKTIDRALAAGWSKETIGHHLVRNNTIYDCGQAGIVGSLGAAFSTVTGNTIHDIHVRRSSGGAEMAGIKFHGAIDVRIAGNHIYRTCLGLWLDWMAQGTRVSGNLFHDNDVDVFVEVDHGPFVIDNNLFLSAVSLRDASQGGAYAHNLFAGSVERLRFDGRQTPYLKAHSTAVAGYHDNPPGDSRFYNNLFEGPADLSVYDNATLPVWMDGNVFLHGAKPSKYEKDPLANADFDLGIRLEMKAGEVELGMRFDQVLASKRTRPEVTTALLGKAVISDLPYEQ
ncbi:MAG: right-handed parallel beta-helix repeat-containing protein, partial [Terracidiphilus sp.]